MRDRDCAWLTRQTRPRLPVKRKRGDPSSGHPAVDHRHGFFFSGAGVPVDLAGGAGDWVTGALVPAGGAVVVLAPPRGSVAAGAGAAGVDERRRSWISLEPPPRGTNERISDSTRKIPPHHQVA